MEQCSCRVFIATSLDGFIARKGGSIDWLDEANKLISPGEDCGYQEFFDQIDVLVMGRNSFEKVKSFDSWLYGSKPVVVMSRTMQNLPPGTPATVSLTALSPREICDELNRAGQHSLYIDGGVTIQNFLREGLIETMTITTIPVLIGNGLPLFGELDQDLKLELVESKSYPFGFVQSTYRVLAS